MGDLPAHKTLLSHTHINVWSQRGFFLLLFDPMVTGGMLGWADGTLASASDRKRSEWRC